MAFMRTKIAMILACVGLLTGAGCAKTEPAASESAAVKYTCPMHPEVVQDKAGSCPKCRMKLVKKK
jgi:hypothetical protein